VIYLTTREPSKLRTNPALKNEPIATGRAGATTIYAYLQQAAE
jgi:hypothetical protein